jgi:hypothetical protein
MVTLAGKGWRRAGLRRTARFEGFGYLGVRRVTAELAREIREALDELGRSEPVAGVVMDLRFAGGEDYRAAGDVAGLFAVGPRLLLRWDDVELRSPEVGRFMVPVVVLVNGETAGAAEALGGALRGAGPAVILGSRTAGRAYAMREFGLASGGRVRIASAAIQLGEGELLEAGIRPDLPYEESLEQERLWMEDPYRLPEGGRGVEVAEARGVRMDEAELVRLHGALTNRPGPVETQPRPVPSAPVLQDRALVRALDLLKGVVRLRLGAGG